MLVASDSNPFRASNSRFPDYSVGVRRITSPTVVAWATALVGLIGVDLDVDPGDGGPSSTSFAACCRREFRPPPASLTLAFGLALLWLARGLARRKRRAWQLAVVLVGGDGGHAPCQGPRHRRGARLARRLRCPLAHAAASSSPRATRSRCARCSRSRSRSASSARSSGCIFDGTVAYSDHVDDALVILIGALATRGLFLWLRPIADRARHVPQSGAARRRSCRNTAATASPTSRCVTTSRSSSRPAADSFLAYRVVGGTAIVTGDPIGDPAERRELIAEFRRVAHSKAWRVAIAGASDDALRDYSELGFKSIYLGDEAFVNPASFSLDGRPIRKVRQSVTRLEKAGYRVELSAPDEIDDGAARRAARRLGGMARQLAGARLHDGDGRALRLPRHGARDRDRARRAHRRLPPARPGAGLRRLLARLDAPPPRHAERVDGVPDRRDDRLGARARRQRAVAQLLCLRRVPARRPDLLRTVLLQLDRLFQLERLHSFNRKFFPSGAAATSASSAGPTFRSPVLAYLHAESLLTPPGPWAKTHDLAAR